MKTIDKNGNDFIVVEDTEEEDKCGTKAEKLMVMLVPLVVIISLVFSFGFVYHDSLSWEFNWNGVLSRGNGPYVRNSGNSDEVKTDKLLGGLLSPGFDESSCISRYMSAIYRKASPHSSPLLLISRLRRYEALHKRCGPGTEPYHKALDNLDSGRQSGPSDCNYVVWISYNGLGNRILTLASTFLYALLTNRVVLVDRANDMADLFCEPFPDTSWLLPKDFPLIPKMSEFNQKSNFSYGNMLRTNAFKNVNDTSVTSSLYIYMGHDYDDHDKLFFCDQDQSLIKNVPWLIIKTDNYFIPSLFLVTSFEQELSNLFPNKETVFHFLGRYLFHPTNRVWGLITRFYEAYLENAHEKIGVQIRLLEANPDNLQYVFDQVLSCLVNETKLIPEITQLDNNSALVQKHKAKTTVLITSLYSGYYERLRDMYWDNPTTTGELIRFFQPSYEKYEQNENKMHNMKAWAEIYLLSLTDKLVTSSRSTFGYVAQSLGGLRPWIMYMPENQTAPNPSCHQGISLEPCSHTPTNYDCKKRTWVNTGKLVPYIRQCEDVSWGQKLFDVDK